MLSPEVISAMYPEGSTLPEWDREDAEKMVEEVVDSWLALDYKKYDFVAVETDYSAYGMHGVIDLLLRDKESQALVVIDWKTSKNTLDATWRQRLVDSYQWRMYAHLVNAQKVIYRGINRKLEKKFIEIEVPKDNYIVVERQLLGINLMREGVKNLSVWPLNTQSCYAFGRQCPYYLDCQGDTMPRKVVELTPLSYSQMQDFLLCPERCRRRRIDPQGKGEDSEETSIGRAVHAGLAEIYQQAFTL